MDSRSHLEMLAILPSNTILSFVVDDSDVYNNPVPSN